MIKLVTILQRKERKKLSRLKKKMKKNGDGSLRKKIRRRKREMLRKVKIKLLNK